MRLKEIRTVPASARRTETRALVEEFLLVTEDLPQEEAARVAGVGVASLRRWKNTGVKQLNGPIRLRLHAYLTLRKLETAQFAADPLPPGIDGL